MKATRVIRSCRWMGSGRALAALLLGCAACTGPTWESKLRANSRQVALALDDPAVLSPEQSFDPASVPLFPAPQKVRPCCVFGMDLKAKMGDMRVPGVEISNIVSIDDLGPHGYDNGKVESEHNGVVYTCRGGFIDVAHIRDNADRMLFIVTQIARILPGGGTFDLPDEGTKRRVTVAPLPEGLLDRRGRWPIATALAEWVNFQMALWHEIVTWYGWQSIKGFSEKISSFSPEDLYSNVLGQKIAAGIVNNREARSRDQYNAAMDAWIPEALRRLGAVSREDGRRAMKAVDGLWWDSRKAVPDPTLVLRRYMNTSLTVSPWTVAATIPPDRLDPALRRACAKKPPILPLETPGSVAGRRIEELVSLDFEFTDWSPEDFPIPSKKGTTVTVADFPAIMAGIHREGAARAGPDFDSPRPRAGR